MKKFHLLVFMTLCTSALLGQYTITYNNNCPQIGDVIHQTYFDEQVDPGPSGTNQSWNFSSVGYYEEGLYQAIDPSNTPFGDQFPESNIAYTYGNAENVYTYGQNSTTEGLNNGMGFDDLNTPVIHYSNPATLMVYPFSYGNTFDDTYYGEFTTSGLTTREHGVISSVADGWGNLTTPTASYANVLRVKINRVVTDSVWMGDIFISTSTFSYTDYSWFAADVRIPVMCITTSVLPGASDTVGYYVAIPEYVDETMNERNKLTLFPNPASEKVFVTFDSEKPENTMISVVDLQGIECIRFDHESISPGIQTCSIPVDGLRKGIYLVNTNKGTKPAKLVVR